MLAQSGEIIIFLVGLVQLLLLFGPLASLHCIVLCDCCCCCGQRARRRTRPALCWCASGPGLSWNLLKNQIAALMELCWLPDSLQRHKSPEAIIWQQTNCVPDQRLFVRRFQITCAHNKTTCCAASPSPRRLFFLYFAASSPKHFEKAQTKSSPEREMQIPAASQVNRSE